MNLFLLRQRPFLSRHTFLIMMIFVAALLLRLAAIGNYITPDELNWVHRSVLFHQAISQGEWAETLTTGHPGVITTWLGAIGIQVQLWLRPSDIATYEWITHLAWLAPENTAAFPQLATFLSAGRNMVAIANCLGLVAVFGLARRLAGDWTAVTMVGLLALDPFVAGLSGLLHVDGLMTTFSTISLLALVVVLAHFEGINPRVRRGRREKAANNPRSSAFIRVPLVLTAVSGAAAGGAILAKSAGLTLIPFVGLAFAGAILAWRSHWRKIIVLGLIWLGAMAAIQLVLLPALWTNPVGSYEIIIGTIFHETEEVLPKTFFMGLNRQAHGAEFYPVALLFRLNPLVFVGLLLAGWFGWQKRREKWWQRPYLLLAAAWPIFFILVLSLATKKYDRYLLPAMPMLFLLGAVGWRQLVQKQQTWVKQISIGGTLLALIYVGTAVPYLLNAYNPLVGGTRTAKQIMPMGWGEAVSAAGQWLAELPDVEEKTAVAGIGPAFAPFFPGKTILRDGDSWLSADYVVETAGGYQNALFGPLHLRSGQTLLHTIRYDGQDQAWVFRVDNKIEQQTEWNSQNNQFDGQIELVAAGTAVQDDQLDIFLRWRLMQPTDGRFNVQVRLLDENDQLWSQVEMPLLNEVYFYPAHWQQDEQPVWRYPLALPLGLPPAAYRVEISLFANENGAQLPVVDRDGRFAGVTQTVAELDLVPPLLFQMEAVIRAAMPERLLDGDLLFIQSGVLPESVLTAGRFTVDLFWQGKAALAADLQLQFWADDLPLTQLPLSRFDSGLWQLDQVIHEKYRVAIPVELKAGNYELLVEIFDENGRSISAPINLGTLDVVSPDRLFSLPDDLGQPVLLRFGDLMQLHGYDLQTETAVTSTLLSTSPNNPVQLTLYWQVDRQPDEIYSTFVHLVGPDGQVVVQGDQWPGGLPSNTWAAGQVIIDEYVIQLPEDAPLGTYQIVLGLYAPSNGLRLPILAEDGAALPGDQFVLPLPLEVGR